MEEGKHLVAEAKRRAKEERLRLQREKVEEERRSQKARWSDMGATLYAVYP